MKLFSKENVIGIFRGFSEGGLEFHADLTLPYRSHFQCTPMHGQFLVVQLETEDEAVLGRITSISSEGRLTSGAGEDYGLRAIADDRPIPEDLREQYLKYRVDIRVLGVLRNVNGQPVFAASHRRLPHVGSKVAFLSDELLREVTGHNVGGADLGFLAFGEFVYSGSDKRLSHKPWMQIRNPDVIPKFDATYLVSRRTFVFARAGFGKSNLIKLLFANLYRRTPTIEKRAGRNVPVGTIIFDPEGEYFWPDDKNRPGLCDVPELEDKIVVFTAKSGPSPFYGSFIAGSIRLDIRRLKPTDVISIALSPEKQDQQNVRKLKALNAAAWAELVDEIYRNGNNADVELIKSALNLEAGQDFELYAARANMTTVVRMLHDPSSQMLDMLFLALKEGKICIVDVSQLRGEAALVLSGIILRKVFDHNQEEFTKARPETIPTVAVVEEAQSVLGGGGSGGEGPYVTWVKEGRKYDLGAVLITQQPGSISQEILSQGDNWFIFHLLSSGDLQAVKRANAHFSDDILSAILNEPIPGNGVFWSSAGGKSYPIPLRVLSFEDAYRARDPEYRMAAADTFAAKLRSNFDVAMKQSASLAEEGKKESISLDESDLGLSGSPEEGVVDEPVDAIKTHIAAVISKLKKDQGLIDKIRTQGIPWKGMLKAIEALLPDTISDKNQVAYDHVPTAMSEIFGPDKWDTEKRQSKSGPGTTTWIVLVGE